MKLDSSLFPSVVIASDEGSGNTPQGTRHSCLLLSVVALRDTKEEPLIPRAEPLTITQAATHPVPQVAMRWAGPAVPWGWDCPHPASAVLPLLNPGLWEGEKAPTVTCDGDPGLSGDTRQQVAPSRGTRAPPRRSPNMAEGGPGAANPLCPAGAPGPAAALPAAGGAGPDRLRPPPLLGQPARPAPICQGAAAAMRAASEELLTVAVEESGSGVRGEAAAGGQPCERRDPPARRRGRLTAPWGRRYPSPAWPCRRVPSGLPGLSPAGPRAWGPSPPTAPRTSPKRCPVRGGLPCSMSCPNPSSPPWRPSVSTSPWRSRPALDCSPWGDIAAMSPQHPGWPWLPPHHTTAHQHSPLRPVHLTPALGNRTMLGSKA